MYACHGAPLQPLQGTLVSEIASIDRQVACGDEHTVVLTISNEVYGFGNGVFDQLGLGTLGVFPSPQRIPGLTVRLKTADLTGERELIILEVLRPANYESK
jgi:alpha-tubulin suppressor-like RCC1 family protein